MKFRPSGQKWPDFSHFIFQIFDKLEAISEKFFKKFLNLRKFKWNTRNLPKISLILSNYRDLISAMCLFSCFRESYRSLYRDLLRLLPGFTTRTPPPKVHHFGKFYPKSRGVSRVRKWPNHGFSGRFRPSNWSRKLF